ncbi:MAG: hypothetical protein H6898_05970 [Rhodobacter sp.]|nr:hypothetical protein [Rhodobacter sp.]
MNRVRIVALAAVGLGVAVVAGTKFQQQREVEQMAAAQPAPAVEQVALASAQAPVNHSLTAPAPRAPAAPALAGNGGLSLTEPPTPRAVAGMTAEAPAPAPLPAQSLNASIAPSLPASLASDAPVVLADQSGTLDAPAAADAAPAEPLDQELQAELDNCAVWVVVTPAPGAMLDMSAYAPCDRDAAVTVSHAGLTVDTRIGADGQMMLMVPALAEDATLTVSFADGRSQSDTTFVPDLAQHERVVLQWQGPATMVLNAYEFGAQFGDSGHVHPGNAMAPGNGEHGFLTVLGDASIADGHRAQVYSYPRGHAPRTGSVALEIEAPVTDASCGQVLDATAIEMHGLSGGQARVIQLDMPACDGAGGYVVLPGVLPDLQIAMN